MSAKNKFSFPAEYIHYIHKNPYAIFALMNLLGDAGYLGLAVTAKTGLNLFQLGGAALTFPAHMVMLAADKPAAAAQQETGLAAKAINGFRTLAICLTTPLRLMGIGERWYHPTAFALLAGNGVGLFCGAAMPLLQHGSLAGLGGASPQLALGGILVAALGSFAYKEYLHRVAIPDATAQVKTHDAEKLNIRADKFDRFAKAIIPWATYLNGLMALATHNPFAIGLMGCFLLSNHAAKNFPTRPGETTAAGARNNPNTPD